jgi:hypothetical protein
VNRLTPGEAIATFSTLRNYVAGTYAWLRKLNTELLAPRRIRPS